MDIEEDKEADLKVPNLKKIDMWKVAAVALAVLSIALLAIILLRGGAGTISPADASAKLLTYLGGQGIAGLQVANVTSMDMFYAVEVLYQGQLVPVFLTKDGKYMAMSIVPLDNQVLDNNLDNNEQPKNITKSDKPESELYIFSYCPAGTAALDAYAKVGKALGSAADMKVKFFSNMHGEHEKQQNMIQECIQNVSKDKYWDYALQYVSKIYAVCGASRDAECDRNESVKLMKSVGINSDAVMNCVNKSGESLYAQDKEDAGSLHLQYSPSVVINGVYLRNADRSPDGLKTSICSAFNTAPSQCNQTLGTSTQSSGSCS